MTRIRAILSILAAGLWIAGTTGCLTNERKEQGPDTGVDQVLKDLRAEAIRAHTEFLADDLLEGRGTGTRGHKLAVNYIRAQCETYGLRGGAEKAGYIQNVPLVRTIVDADKTTLRIEAPHNSGNMRYGTDFVLLDTHRETEGRVSGELVFVGYGVTAPEQGYDDYAGLDVKGKIVVLLRFEAPASFSPAVRAYYSNHDYKRANAAAHGAAGAIYIGSAAEEKRFSWGSMLRELQVGFNSMRWVRRDGIVEGLDDSLKAFGVLNQPGAETIFAGEKHSYPDILAAAEKGTLPRFALTKKVTIALRSRHEKVEGENVVAMIEGSDPKLKSEYVLFSGHVDHLGIGPAIDGDAIYNGAMDNAGGCAVLLEVARCLSALRQRPARSLVFLFVTAEEEGMLGSDYFASNPTIPAEKIAANINVDGATSTVPLEDVIAFGAEHSSLQADVEQAAVRTGFKVTPDPFAEECFFVRSDQFSFVKKGVPAVFVSLGIKSTKPGVDGLAILKQWLLTVYHSPKDDLSQPIQYEASARLGQFLAQLGFLTAADAQRPRWNKNDFFNAKFNTGGAPGR